MSGSPSMIEGILKSALVILFLATLANAEEKILFGVLGLFHPRELALEQDGTQVVSVSGSATALVLNGEPGHRRLLFRAVGERVRLGGLSEPQWTATARDGSEISFQLAVPGKLHRAYRGLLTVKAHQGELIAVVAMNRELAVASIVAAEMNEKTPLEALKAQAVVTRSFLASDSRHREFDFCDTTHCQFLRSPPAADSTVTRAVEATRGLVLTYREKIVAAMYSSRCGGQTHSLRESGMNPGEGYPYFSVECRYCRQHPIRWQSRIDAAGKPDAGSETQRIRQARLWGWSAIPGSAFKAKQNEEGWLIEGHSIGHGLGMCQFGAAGMATSGAGFRAILSHYYPNTELAATP